MRRQELQLDHSDEISGTNDLHPMWDEFEFPNIAIKNPPSVEHRQLNKILFVVFIDP